MAWPVIDAADTTYHKMSNNMFDSNTNFTKLSFRERVDNMFKLYDSTKYLLETHFRVKKIF